MSMLSLCDGWWMRVYPLGFTISLHLVLVSLFHFDILYFHGKRRQPIYCFFRFFVHLFNEHNSQWETRIKIMRKFNVIVSRPRLSFPNCRYLNGTPDNILNRTITLIALCVCVWQEVALFISKHLTKCTLQAKSENDNETHATILL